VPSGIAIWVYRQTSQEVCPWNEKFARYASYESPFQSRAALAGRDARTLARELLAMTQEALEHDEPLVRDHARWALGRIHREGESALNGVY
jgi:epoxyqueuosine reductase QueG